MPMVLAFVVLSFGCQLPFFMIRLAGRVVGRNLSVLT